MAKPPQDLAKVLMRRPFEELTESERAIVTRFAEWRHISRNTNREYDEGLTLGQRLADRMAEFGGSWTFIGIAVAVLACWIGLNVWLLIHRGKTFDPYPFILLNLVLSMLAALQAPVIMMSQNRQEAKDRINAAHDYEVNLKAELEVMQLHDKLDALRESQWTELIAMQQKQIEMLQELIAKERA